MRPETKGKGEEFRDVAAHRAYIVLVAVVLLVLAHHRGLLRFPGSESSLPPATHCGSTENIACTGCSRSLARFHAIFAQMIRLVSENSIWKRNKNQWFSFGDYISYFESLTKEFSFDNNGKMEFLKETWGILWIL